MSYALRQLFDPGSGVCLWAVNDKARQRYGYPVEQSMRPLSENTQTVIQHLIAWLDSSIDWSSPGDSATHWSVHERARFQAASAHGLRLLREELPSGGYEVVAGAD